jgi:hypothetical protein
MLAATKASFSGNKSFDIDRLHLQWRNANRHCQRHQTVDLGSGLALAGLAVAGIVEREVAAFAAAIGGLAPLATITATCRRTRSAAIAGSRS